MSTLFVFLQIQIVASLVAAAALRRCLRRSVRPIIKQNCRKLDGTYSQRRKLIELQSLRHASLSIVIALASQIRLYASLRAGNGRIDLHASRSVRTCNTETRSNFSKLRPFGCRFFESVAMASTNDLHRYLIGHFYTLS